jgi:WXG100 family type VII secretion target
MTAQVVGTMVRQVATLEQAAGQIRGVLPGLQESWIGEDAEAFSREVTQGFLPAATAMIPALAAFAAAFTQAAEVIEQADREAKGMADGLAQELGRVF